MFNDPIEDPEENGSTDEDPEETVYKTQALKFEAEFNFFVLQHHDIARI